MPRKRVELGMPRMSRSVDPVTIPGRSLPHDGTGDERTRPASSGLVDTYGRTATDLRVSLTDFCNLRCTYCMPAQGLDFLRKNQLMSTDEIVRLVDIAVHHLGVQQVRFTGGEPLTRPELPEILSAVASLSPRPDLSLTTNAIGLDTRAEALRQAGLNRVNVSLDSVVSETFERLTRRPLLHRVLDGIDGALAAGLTPLKVNAVLMPGINDHEAADLLAWCLDRGLQLRFIEQMPLDAGHTWQRRQIVTASDVLDLLSQRFTLTAHSAPRNGSPAELFDVRQAGSSTSDPVLGQVGVIASVTRPFCGDCRRTRLTAEGRVRTCLFAREETDLLTSLRSGASDTEIADLWRLAHWGKQAGHGMNREDFVQPERPMSAIGG
ncbi:GTP 3',8-cyclase MoaA [Devriesea agamarum]|uniref:GTP 3',8-cyclase MoaA n=1 Tax=Devriesea agamarum TaxID=472569 RepID=UPI000A03C970|nr:GTP 3',8-cyclase MoaA [Devriesea agamarum]